jgi:hypothetical protein
MSARGGRAVRRLGVASLAVLVGGGACGTVYRPAPSPRIALVVHGGGVHYVKDGRETPVGPLGGDLESLVGGDAEAAPYARRARRELAVGIPAYVVGVAAVVVGLVVGKPAGWIAVGGGALVGGAGLGLMGAGAVDAIDAVNVYNDRAAPRPP